MEHACSGGGGAVSLSARNIHFFFSCHLSEAYCSDTLGGLFVLAVRSNQANVHPKLYFKLIMLAIAGVRSTSLGRL